MPIPQPPGDPLIQIGDLHPDDWPEIPEYLISRLPHSYARGEDLQRIRIRVLQAARLAHQGQLPPRVKGISLRSLPIPDPVSPLRASIEALSLSRTPRYVNLEPLIPDPLIVDFIRNPLLLVDLHVCHERRAAAWECENLLMDLERFEAVLAESDLHLAARKEVCSFVAWVALQAEDMEWRLMPYIIGDSVHELVINVSSRARGILAVQVERFDL